MGIKGDLIKRLGGQSFVVGEVNEGIGNLDLAKWGFYRRPEGRIVRLPADPITRKRNKNKGFVYLGEELPDEPLQEE